jgi:hypothetical protein
VLEIRGGWNRREHNTSAEGGPDVVGVPAEGL